MTLKEIKERTNVNRIQRSQYNVVITYRGRKYTCNSNNSAAWDRLDDPDYTDTKTLCGYTNKGAWNAFYDECKRKNNLGGYKHQV